MTPTSRSRPQQGALLDLPATAPQAVDGEGVSEPVARVVVDVTLPHLDHTFDYLVPPAMASVALPGTRVQVRFAGRDRSAYVVERRSDTDHRTTLAPLRRAVSPVPVLSPTVLDLCRAVADRYAGTLMDVVRLAVPPRHATTEKAVLEKHAPGALVGAVVDPPDSQAWQAYTGGPAFLRHLAAGESPRAVWTALPGHEPVPGAALSNGSASVGSPAEPTVPEGVPPWPTAIAQAAQATLASGRGVLVVVPTTRHVTQVVDALAATLPNEPVARLVADDGPARRYRAFLRTLLGEARLVVGTRAAAFAPVTDLGLAVIFDDGDDRLAEPRAPYPHARQVLALRAEREGAALLVGGFTRTVEAQLLVEQRWAHPVQAPREVLRRVTPRVEAPGEVELAREGPAAAARIPHPAWRIAKEALTTGPVLVQVARGGYVPVVACARCREPARCRTCHGPLRLERAGAAPSCSWCGRIAADWACSTCGDNRVRATRVGSTRTAEELGRAFPSVPVVISGATADHGVVETVDDRPRLVVATPGAEPVARGGYAAALLLDGAASTSRPELWASAEALRRWLGAAALVRGAEAGGRVMLLGQPAPVPAQALVRWDPAGFAARELAERAELSFPPAVRLAAVQGPPTAVRSLLGHLEPLDGLEVLGPVAVEAPDPRTEAPAPTRRPRNGSPRAAARPVPPRPLVPEPEVRAVLRVDRRQGAALSRRLAHAAAARSARKEDGAVRVQVDPPDLW
ncbi:primosomal protein N' [Georgenia yuyongxinii]|uniref:Probable replication restart protein PriA n=1 Tax=Georgenia yuyongxinii TaxID=2589797 RepID=A0A5B8C665_9MICO|nr:primosomal protein N' [Georgenia yuyongxinii]QDC24881.1 primosomal protein N' [Georgenia yuyongxinii]